jgi:hypothetical protein
VWRDRCQPVDGTDEVVPPRAIGVDAGPMSVTGMTFRRDADRRARSSAAVGRIKGTPARIDPSDVMPSMRAPELCKSWLVDTVMFMWVPSYWPPTSVQAQHLARANRPPATNQLPEIVSKTVRCMFFPEPDSCANHLIRQRRGRVRQCIFRDRNRWLPARPDRQISTLISEIRAAVTKRLWPDPRTNQPNRPRVTRLSERRNGRSDGPPTELHHPWEKQSAVWKILNPAISRKTGRMRIFSVDDLATSSSSN